MKPGEQGKRSDLSDAAAKVLAKRPLSEVAEEHPTTFARYGRGLRDLAATVHPSDRLNSWSKPARYLWIWGPTGSGKTSWVFAKYDHSAIFTKDRSKWFNGFDPQQHRVILIDDFRLGRDSLQLDDFLRIAQPFACRVETKGGYVELGSQDIIVTSNYHPAEIWSQQEIAPLVRRFHVVQKKLPVKLEPGDDGDLILDSPAGIPFIVLDSDTE